MTRRSVFPSCGMSYLRCFLLTRSASLSSSWTVSCTQLKLFCSRQHRQRVYGISLCGVWRSWESRFSDFYCQWSDVPETYFQQWDSKVHMKIYKSMEILDDADDIWWYSHGWGSKEKNQLFRAQAKPTKFQAFKTNINGKKMPDYCGWPIHCFAFDGGVIDTRASFTLRKQGLSWQV